MRKVQLGAGSKRHWLDGWENYDRDVDIRKPLPFADASIDIIMLEHVIEHVTQHEAYRFVDECHRVLLPGGILRISFPDVKKIQSLCNDRYVAFVRKYLKRDVDTKVAVEQIIFNFDHKSFWTVDSMETMLRIVGFVPKEAVYNRSDDPNLNGIETHWRSIGRFAANLETSVVEGRKP